MKEEKEEEEEEEQQQQQQQEINIKQLFTISYMIEQGGITRILHSEFIF